jgi:hypothetical protein
MTTTFNNILCIARKNQTNNYDIQCPFKKINGDFCGKHRNYLLKKLIPINHIENRPDNRDENRDESVIKEEDKSNTKLNKFTKKKNAYLIKPYEYHNISKTTLTLIDYLYDKELKYSDNFIKKSYKYYKLDKYIKERKATRNLNEEEKKMKMQTIKNSLQSFFETMLLGNIHIESLVFLQKTVKKYLSYKQMKIYGPALNNRSLCNNQTDFYSFDDIADIESKYFFSYKDKDGFIYGFHVESFINLISNETEPKNPYNRVIINKTTKDKAIKIWADLTKKKETSNYVTNNNAKDLKNKVKNKCLLVFQKMDLFGYQTKIDWILNLPIGRVRQLFKSIKNNWEYKAGLSDEVKTRIYPHGNPFIQINISRINNINRYIAIDTVLDLMDLFVSNGVTNDDTNQGCILLLFSINDVNRECGQCNPWLV